VLTPSTIAAAQGLTAAHGFLAAQGFVREALRGAQGFARQGAAMANPPNDKVSAPEAINALKSLVRFIVFSLEGIWLSFKSLIVAVM